MDSELSGKVVLVTGGSKGLGLACARAFLAEGAKVAIAARNLDNLREAREQLEGGGRTVCTVQADLTRAGDAQRMVETVTGEIGFPEVLVNSAGAAKRTPLFELTEADWRAAIDAKFFSYINAMMACLPGMAAAGRGSIVNIIGMGGKIAAPTHLPGGAANAALMLVTAGLANGYASKGVRVNSVNPALAMTERVQAGFAADARHGGVSEEEAARKTLERLPLGRIARPEEIAEVVVFLASGRASYVNGVNMALDGAMFPTVV
jgi:NAD(P)-dependent dehydrogenase (short-subunit alcohol dehydrogenase family)